jgi:hypothetical protein
VAAAALAVTLAGCVQGAKPQNTPTTAPATSAAPTPTPTVAPAFVPGGTASDNKAFFDYINQQVVTAKGNAADGPSFITSLRDNGFPGDAMQVTPDITTVGVKADSIQFSVHLSDACLIGQWSAVGGYTSLVAPALASGGCLIGQTRTIDF